MKHIKLFGEFITESENIDENKKFDITSKEESELKKLETEWNNETIKFFKSKFKNSEMPNNIIGAGVQIIRSELKRGTKYNYIVQKWRGTGATGEWEAYNKIKDKIEKLGFDSKYLHGTLD